MSKSFVQSLGQGLLVVAFVTGSASAVLAQAFDVGSVPRPEGAEIASDRPSSSHSITYVYPASVAATIAATEKALGAGNWQRYRTPDQEPSSNSLRFKNDKSGIYVSFTMADGRPDRSRISYSHNNSIPANLPFPPDASETIYDENRPFLRSSTAMGIEAAHDFFSRGLTAEGWSELTRDAIQSRWPNAILAEPADGARRAYFGREGRSRQEPVLVTLQRVGERTVVDIRIASFALPQDLPFYQEFAGLPAPRHTKTVGGTGSPDSPRRESRALVIAELPVVLAFYRREMSLRGWKEQEAGAVVTSTSVRVLFTQPDSNALLELGQRYDFTTVRLTAQLSEAAIAERARAKKEADAKWMRDAVQQAQELAAASDARRREQAARIESLPVQVLRPLASSPAPIPVPEDSDEVRYDGNRGKLDFVSQASPKSVASFYREHFKARGWKEGRSVIDGPTMVRMDFANAAQKVGFTVMLFGTKTKVSADGSGLEAPVDPNRETEKLEGEDKDGFPVPKNYSMSSPGQFSMRGSATAFRREFNARVPADIGSVLAFYRRELGKRAWKEAAEPAVIQPQNVRLAYVSPEGPARLSLGREGRETTIAIVVKNPAEAAKADALPPAGMGRIVLGNVADEAATIVVNQKSVRVPAGMGRERPPKELMLDLKPGKYRYVLKVAGKRDRSDEITIAADETWALLIGPGGVLPMQMY